LKELWSPPILLAGAINSDYNPIMKIGELKRWLKEQGVIFEEGKRHTMDRLGSRFTPIPRHADRDIKTGTLQSILKQLGLKPPQKQ